MGDTKSEHQHEVVEADENHGPDLASSAAPTSKKRGSRKPSPGGEIERRVTRSQTAPRHAVKSSQLPLKKPVTKKPGTKAKADSARSKAMSSSKRGAASKAITKPPASEKRSAKTKVTSQVDEKPIAPAKEPKAKRQRVVEPKATALVNIPSEPADLFVFGSNPFGALGLGEDETVKYRPAQVSADVGDSAEGIQFLQISCGGMHTIALASDGTVWTWGVNDEGALGRKTDGTCWEESSDKGDAYVPGKADMPPLAGPVTQV